METRPRNVEMYSDPVFGQSFAVDGSATVSERSRIAEVAAVFLKLGTIGFGGPAAHVALMEAEVVRRRRWLDRQAFLDLLGVVNLIPGPNSTELALYLGGIRAGWPGLFVAGAAFILPAMLLVLAFAWVYVRFGARPEIDWALYGVKPVVIALVIRVIGDLGTVAVKGPVTFAGGALALALSLWGVDPVLLLFAVATAVAFGEAGSRFRIILPPLLGGLTVAPVPGAAAPGLTAIFLVFLKYGAVIFGSGYTLLAFLEADLVHRFGWVTQRELLDAIAIGQFTPGPLFTTATFIGYLLAGVPGALLATAGIFLPSFVLVAATRPILPRLRRSRVAAAFLDGANVASLGLLVMVVLELASEALTDAPAMAIGAAAMTALWLTRIHPGWLVAIGAIIGVLARALETFG